MSKRRRTRFIPPALLLGVGLRAGLFVVGGGAVAGGGCVVSDEDDGSDDGGADDARCPADLPPPSDPCLADQCGNDRGVGRPCTRGGGQCDVFNLVAGEAGICIPDFADNTAVHACSMPCSSDEDCGDDAVCADDPADPSRRGCSLRACEGR